MHVRGRLQRCRTKSETQLHVWSDGASLRPRQCPLRTDDRHAVYLNTFTSSSRYILFLRRFRDLRHCILSLPHLMASGVTMQSPTETRQLTNPTLITIRPICNLNFKLSNYLF